jgi:hypothetical protein
MSRLTERNKPMNDRSVHLSPSNDCEPVGSATGRSRLSRVEGDRRPHERGLVVSVNNRLAAFLNTPEDIDTITGADPGLRPGSAPHHNVNLIGGSHHG